MAGPAGARPAGGRAPADRDRDPGRRDRRAAAGGRTADRQAAPFRHVAVGVAARGGPGAARERGRAGRARRGRGTADRSAPGPQPRPDGCGIRLGGRVRAAGRRRGGPAELAAWRGWLDATGVVRRLAPSPDVALALLGQVAAVLRRLPSRGIPIGRLAAECCGDAHALDDGRPAGTLALSAVRALAGLPFAADVSADSRRAAWACVGVHLDDLSSLVLCLGLPGDTRTALGRVLALHREAGQPAVLTLRQLRCHDAALSAGLVRICENPVVIAAAADELGSRCPPLVCVGGQPSAAGWRLLDLLAAGGAEFRYHGDFDWGGIRIASAVRQRGARDSRAGSHGGTTGTLMRPRQRQWWLCMPPRGCPGWQASRSRPPGIRAWRPPWRATTFASRRNSPSTPCSRTWHGRVHRTANAGGCSLAASPWPREPG